MPEGDPTPTPPPTPPPTPADPPRPSADEGWKALLARKEGDMAALARSLFEENFGLREKNRDLRGRVVPEKAVVLKEDEAKVWNEYQALGKAADLKAALSERDQFRDELEKGRKATLFSRAAQAHGYKAAVLQDLAQLKGLSLEVKDETVSGKAVPVAYVKHQADGKEATTRLPDYVQQHMPEYLASLTDKSGRGGPDPARPGTPPRALPTPPPPPTGQPQTQTHRLHEGRSVF